MPFAPLLGAMLAMIAPPPPEAFVPQRELVIENASGADIRRFYPLAALKAGAQTRVTATCRVTRDRRLACRDAVIDLPVVTGPKAWLQPEFDPLFTQATIALLATFKVAARLRSGGDSVGREARMSVNWAL